MIVCPNLDCAGDELEAFEVETRMTLTGLRMYVECPHCGQQIEVEVLVLEPTAD